MEREQIRIRVRKKSRAKANFYEEFISKDEILQYQVRIALDTKEDIGVLRKYLSNDYSQSSAEMFGTECNNTVKKLVALLQEVGITSFTRCIVITKNYGNYIEYSFQKKGNSLQKLLEETLL